MDDLGVPLFQETFKCANSLGIYTGCPELQKMIGKAAVPPSSQDFCVTLPKKELNVRILFMIMPGFQFLLRSDWVVQVSIVNCHVAARRITCGTPHHRASPLPSKLRGKPWKIAVYPPVTPDFRPWSLGESWSAPFLQHFGNPSDIVCFNAPKKGREIPTAPHQLPSRMVSLNLTCPAHRPCYTATSWDTLYRPESRLWFFWVILQKPWILPPDGRAFMPFPWNSVERLTELCHESWWFLHFLLSWFKLLML